MRAILEHIMPGQTFNLKQFMLAGNATFTVTSENTGVHFTLKVEKPKPGAPHFVSVLTGPNNEADYQFVGTIFPDGNYRHGKKSRIGEDAPSAKAARWVCERTIRGLDLPHCRVQHEGRCGRCGRKLTNPISIESGIGPECANHL